MLLLKIDEESRQPKYRQIMEQIQQKIESRSLRPGEPLPSTRRLAEKLGIHRSTVAVAYQELWALGNIDLRPGSCPRVRERMRTILKTGHDGKGAILWQRTASNASNAVWQAFLNFHPEAGQDENKPFINFSSLDMDPRLFPAESFRSCLNRAMKKRGKEILGYGDRAGFPPLREYVARRLQSHGIAVSSEELLLTNGSQQGIDLVLRMIAEPGRRVAVESPTYAQVIPLLKFHGLRPLEIPVRRDGMDLAILADRIKKERPHLVYTMPNFQNPTGVSTSQVHRERLLSLCEAHKVPILEDGFEEEMKYFGRVVLPVKSMDTRQLVIYCGTFSKILFPGIRIGWVAAEKECIQRLIAIRRFTDLSSSMILQAALHDFCQSGYYDRHISKMHRVFRKRMQAALRALRQHISPEWAEWEEPSGGYLIWMKMKPVADPLFAWQEHMAKHGVHVAPGSYFFFSRRADAYVRLSISTLNEEEIAEGVRRLAMAMRQVFTGKKR